MPRVQGWLGLAVLLASLGPLDGRAAPPGLAVGGAQTHRLANGLTVIVAEDRSTPLVSVLALHPVGARDDPADRPGLSHLLEHVLVMRPESAVASYMEPSLQMRATTGWDNTVYQTAVIHGNVDVALWNVALRLTAFDRPRRVEELLPLARASARQEELQKANGAGAGLFGFATEALYPPGHPYHLVMRSEMGTLAAATPEELRTFHARHYRAESTVVAIVGDVTAADVVERAEHFLGPLPGKPGWQRPPPPNVPLDPARRLTVEANVGNPRLLVVYPAPSSFGAGGADVALLPWLMLGRSGWLTRRLVHERGLVTSLNAGYSGQQLGGTFWMTLELGDQPADVVLGALDEELARLSANISTQDVARVRARDALARTRRWSALSSRADVLAEAVALTGSTRAVMEFTAQLGSVTRERLRAAIDRLRPDSRVVAWLKPEARASLFGRLAGESLRAAPTLIRLASPPPPLREPPAGAVVPIPRPFPPPSAGVVPQDPPIEAWVLDNGLRILLSPRRQFGRVGADLIVQAGIATVAPADDALAEATAALLLKGTRRRSAEAFALDTENLGSDFGVVTRWDDTEIGFETTSGQIDKALELLAEAVRQPAYTRAELELWQRQKRRAWAEYVTYPAGIAETVLDAKLFPGGTPYGSTTGTPEALARLTVEALQGFHQRAYHPGNATLVVVADTAPKALRKLVERHFGDWQAAPGTLDVARVRPGHLPGTRALLVDVPGAPHASVAVGALAAATTPLDRALGSMVEQQLVREVVNPLEGSLAYSAAADFAASRGMQRFTVHTSVEPDRVDEAITLIRRGIESVRGRLPEKFGNEREGLIRTLAWNAGTFEGIAWLLKTAVQRDEGTRPVAVRLTAYNSALPDQVRAFAHSWLAPERQVVVVAGDARRIAPSLAKLGAFVRAPNPYASNSR